MLGGNNANNCYGEYYGRVYYINENGYIDQDYISRIEQNTKFIIYTLQQFKGKFPYKVGDKVNAPCKGCVKTITSMEWDTYLNTVTYKLDNRIYTNIDQLKVVNELQPYKEETIEDKLNLLQQLKDYFDNTPREVVEKEWHEYDKYNEISPKVNEYLEYIDNIRQPKYSKNYEECCEVLGSDPSRIIVLSNRKDIIHEENKHCYEMYNLYQLLICRDAYWKIAGDWKPDWSNDKQNKYIITCRRNNIILDTYTVLNYILAFPTEEMRDAFYENFKELIEAVKELL